ncbi:MAG: hypothetical protein AB7H88_02975 [Vicinamibacterales bacterium]
MKYTWLAGILLLGFLVVPAGAQTTGAVPTGETSLGTVTIPRTVMADGKPLMRGRYQVRLTAQAAMPAVAGQSMERWVEFVQGGETKGREVVSIVPADEWDQLYGETGPRPATGGVRVEMLKGNDYLRIWINRGGINYLIHLPPQS